MLVWLAVAGGALAVAFALKMAHFRGHTQGYEEGYADAMERVDTFLHGPRGPHS